MISRQEENKASLIAVITSFVIAALLVLFLLWLTIHVPNPPFPVVNLGDPGGGGGSTGPVVVSVGTPEMNDNYTMPKSKEDVQPPPSNNDANNIVSNDGVNINEVKNLNKNDVHVPNKDNNHHPENNNIKNWTNNLNNANNNATSGGTSGGPVGNIGNSPFPGSTGGGGTTGNPGPGGTGGLLGNGRKTVKLPCAVDDSNEEGVVVVTIKVNKNGDVIDADPNGAGTNTSNSVLKMKARQAAFCAKFEPCTDCADVSKGTVVFKFTFGGK